ncbi:hypothetical protein D3C85_1804200 [compost metagenome]
MEKAPARTAGAGGAVDLALSNLLRGGVASKGVLPSFASFVAGLTPHTLKITPRSVSAIRTGYRISPRRLLLDLLKDD